jgi:hypothetical protein
MKEWLSELTVDLPVRLSGMAAAAAGFVLGWFFIYLPLQRARAGVPDVRLYGRFAFVAAPLLVVVGLAYMLGGERLQFNADSGAQPAPSRMGWAIILTATAVGIGTFLWVDAQLSALGYR